ncbi:MAG: thioredoxin [Lachnospiraceae bacterium]|nr:thioredoxin [Lachnospiraceae bacterium]
MAAIKFTEANFEEEVLKADRPVLVDLWASWCGPCKMQGPIVEQLADEVSEYKIGKLDVDENPEIAEKYNVMSIPTLLVFSKGEVVAKAVGVTQKDQLLEMLAKA